MLILTEKQKQAIRKGLCPICAINRLYADNHTCDDCGRKIDPRMYIELGDAHSSLIRIDAEKARQEKQAIADSLSRRVEELEKQVAQLRSRARL